MARPKLSGDVQYVRGCRPRPKAAQVRGLDRGAIGHRIGEGHAQLDHICAALDQRVKIGRGVAIACCDESRRALGGVLRRRRRAGSSVETWSWSKRKKESYQKHDGRSLNPKCFA